MQCQWVHWPWLSHQYVVVSRCGIQTSELQSLQVKCVLMLYSTGAKVVPSKRSKGSFSDIGWSTKTLLYMQLIIKVGDRKFDQIISRTWEYCSTAICSRQAQATHNVSESAAGRADMNNDQILIAVSFDIEADSELDDEDKLLLAEIYLFLIAHYLTGLEGKSVWLVSVGERTRKGLSQVIRYYRNC